MRVVFPRCVEWWRVIINRALGFTVWGLGEVQGGGGYQTFRGRGDWWPVSLVTYRSSVRNVFL